MASTAADRNGGEIQSVSRALMVLEAVGAAHEIGVSELARDVGLAVSTVHGLVKTLSAHNYLIGEQGRYRLGPAVAVLMSHWDPVPSLVPLMRPVLEKLNLEIGHAVTGKVLVGRDVHTVGYMTGRGEITTNAGPAVSNDPLEFATGQVLVAMGPDELWPAFISATRGRTPTISQRKWMAQLQHIRASGLAVKPPPDARGHGALAVPVWGRNGSVLCSLGSSAAGFMIDELFNQNAVNAMWDAATLFSEQLGCPELPLPRPTIKSTTRLSDRT